MHTFRWVRSTSLGIGLLVWAAGEARADGLTYSAEEPAGVFTTANLASSGATGTAVTTDGELTASNVTESRVEWVLGGGEIAIAVSQTVAGNGFPTAFSDSYGTFVFQVDTRYAYDLSGMYSYGSANPPDEIFGNGWIFHVIQLRSLCGESSHPVGRKAGSGENSRGHFRCPPFG